MAQPEVAEPTTTNLRDVRVFCSVLDLGSLTAAAKAHRETKGNISRRVVRLERALGVSLLRHGPRRVVPTDAGRAYRESMREALKLFDQAAARLQTGRVAPRGRLRVTAPFDIGLCVLPPVVARFIELYPAVSVEVLTTDRVLDMDAQQVDLALRAAIKLPDSSLLGRRLRDLNVGFYAAPSYMRGRRAPRSLRDLAEHRVLLLDAVPDTLVARTAASSKGKLRSAVRGDGAFLRELALAGGGIAPLPTLLATRDVAEGRLVRLLPHVSPRDRYGLFLLYPPARAESPAVQAFRDLLVEWLEREDVASAG